MKLSKHHKETIRHILCGDIYDIVSYLKYFDLGTQIKIDKNEIVNKFNADELPKRYYYHKSVMCKYSNMLTEADYLNKLQNDEITPQNYISAEISLSYNSGIKQETWNETLYSIDFYDGVYIANSFANIIDFLTLWQYLKSEMLILEVPHHFSSEVLGLFYVKDSDTNTANLSLAERIKSINFNDFTYDDGNYLQENNYILSKEHCIMCQEFMDKRIYPSTKLNIFVKKHFTTYEEKTQNRALFVAWLAIFVSIILTFAPYLHQEDNPNLTSLVNDINEIKNTINTKDSPTELTSSLNAVLEKLDLIIEHLSKESKKNPPEEKK